MIWAIPCLLWRLYLSRFYSSVFHLTAALLQLFSQMKEQLPDPFSAWFLQSGSSGQSLTARPSPTGCRPCHHCGQHLPHLPLARCNQVLLLSSGSISAADIFFVCLLFLNIFISSSANNKTTSSDGEGSVPVLCAAGGDTACCGTVME